LNIRLEKSSCEFILVLDHKFTDCNEELNCIGVKLTTFLHLVQKSRMAELYSTPPYIFVAFLIN
jgi:hypothetical protein